MKESSEIKTQLVTAFTASRTDDLCTISVWLTFETAKEQVRSQGMSIILFFITPKREWADPGGTAIPGQPVEKPEQAPESTPMSKNQFNIEVPRWGTYQILS